MWANSKTNYLINRKAQAILELATFGSFLLFCLALLIHFGLSMNFQQNAQMQAFRKGLKMAYYSQGPGSSPSYVMIKDKPVVDPRDKWGFGERIPVGGGSSTTWDPNLNGLYVADSEDDPDVRDLPRMYIEVDKSVRVDDAQINDNLDNIGVINKTTIDPNAKEDKGIFTLADFGATSLNPESTLRIYVPDTAEGGYYYLDVQAQDIRVKEDPDDPRQKYALYLEASGLVRRLGSVDLYPDDNKVRQVNIVAVNGTVPCDEDKNCGNLSWIRYINPRIGDMNPENMEVERDYVDPETGIVVVSDKPLEMQQGLLTDSSRKNTYGAGTKIIVKEQGKDFSTETQSGATQTITHKIGYQIRLAGPTLTGEPLMGREVMEVPVEHKQPASSYNWKVTNE